MIAFFWTRRSVRKQLFCVWSSISDSSIFLSASFKKQSTKNGSLFNVNFEIARISCHTETSFRSSDMTYLFYSSLKSDGIFWQSDIFRCYAIALYLCGSNFSTNVLVLKKKIGTNLWNLRPFIIISVLFMSKGQLCDRLISGESAIPEEESGSNDFPVEPSFLQAFRLVVIIFTCSFHYIYVCLFLISFLSDKHSMGLLPAASSHF